MRATTRRSAQIMNSVMTMRNANTTTVLRMISHHMSRWSGETNAARNELGRYCVRHHREPPSRLTTAPAPTPRVRCTSLPTDRVGTHTTPSGIAVIEQVERDRRPPFAARIVTGAPSATPNARALAGDKRARNGFAVAARYGVASCRLPASSSSCHVARIARPALSFAGGPGFSRRCRHPTMAGTKCFELRPRGAQIRQSKMDVECIGQCIEYLQVEQLSAFGERRLEGTRTAFPVEERAGLFDGRCNREDDVGCVSHIGTPQLKAHHEAGGVDGGTRRSRVGQVVGVDAGDDECTQRTAATRRRECQQCRGPAWPEWTSPSALRPDRARRCRLRRDHPATGSVVRPPRPHLARRHDAAPTRAWHRSLRPTRRRRTARPPRRRGARRPGSRSTAAQGRPPPRSAAPTNRRVDTRGHLDGLTRREHLQHRRFATGHRRD